MTMVGEDSHMTWVASMRTVNLQLSGDLLHLKGHQLGEFQRVMFTLGLPRLPLNGGPSSGTMLLVPKAPFQHIVTGVRAASSTRMYLPRKR